MSQGVRTVENKPHPLLESIPHPENFRSPRHTGMAQNRGAFGLPDAKQPEYEIWGSQGVLIPSAC